MQTIWNILPPEAEVFFISTEDEFLNEYTPEYNQRLKFLTGFTGSLGFFVMQKTGANFLFIDGRYTLQASLEISENIQIKNIDELESFLLTQNKEIWFDSKHHAFKFINSLINQGVKFKEVEENPVDEIWKRESKEVASREAIIKFELAGEDVKQKIEKVQKYLEQEKADALFIFDTTDVSFIFNLRGNFLPNTPTIPFFGIVFASHIASRETLNENFKLLTLNDIYNIKGYKLLVPSKISFYIYNELVKNNTVIVEKKDYISSLKIIKTESEIECIRRAHIEDGKALKKFAEYLSKIASRETEFTLGQKLLEFRKEQKGFISESFSAIIGFKENGAIIHYRAKEESCKKIEGEGILLVDSGGQYYDKNLKIAGTTDVTRTFYIGKAPTEKQKRIYTLVLKGHIALATAVFPEGTKGYQLDALARRFLWQAGLDYKHGTGHGVGFFLSVHEAGGVSKTINLPLQAGMIISNEPGCYLEGEFGVRFESLMLVKKAEQEGFLCFEILTKALPESKLLDFEILSDEELNFLQNLHTS